MTKGIEYKDASPEVRAVYDEIKTARKVPDVTNFWKHLASDPATLRRTWESINEVMGPGEIDNLTKEMLFLAVSTALGCHYCIASHTMSAKKAGMSEKMFGELMAIVGMASETSRLVSGYRIPLDPIYDK